MLKNTPQVVAHSIVAVSCLLLAATLALLVYVLDIFSSPFLFATAILLEICLLLVLAYSVVRALDVPRRILTSVLISAWDGAMMNPYIRRLEKTKSHPLLWTARRLNPRSPTGLLLSVGVLLALHFFFDFVSVLIAVLRHGLLTQIDVRTLNLMPWVRTDTQTAFFRFATFLAGPESVILLVILMAAIFWGSRKWLAGWLVIAVATAEEACAFIIKILVARPRPDRALALVSEHDYGFPSGHTLAATVLFGLLAYFLYRSYRRPVRRLIIALSYVVAVGLVAVSRVYLGAHYPTDVMGSIYFGLGLLILVITGIEVAVRTRWHDLTGAKMQSRLLIVVAPVMVGVSALAAPYFVHISEASASPHFQTISAIDQQTVQRLPLNSETLAGKASEPISFIYIGSEDQIKHLFLAHGWYQADRSTVANTLQAVSVGFQGRQYLTAPVTPAYLAMQPETIAFEQPTQSNTLRQRHHTRLWRTDFKLANGQEVWAGTASFDEGIELAGRYKLPTHRIAPDLDAERDYIIQSLGVKNVYYLSVAHAQAGENASGDIFFTDGRAAVIAL